jgi:hypothetical protein
MQLAKETEMTEEARPPFDFDGLNVPEQDATATEKAAKTIKKAAEGVGAAYEQARKPGMPLSILSNIAREAPLGSLFVAFLLGVAVARKR